MHSGCTKLMAEVQNFVQPIIDDHRARRAYGAMCATDEALDFVDILLLLQDSENLADADIIAILWVNDICASFIEFQ